MNGIFISTFDNRASYRRDKHYPRLISLATVLRWSVTGSRVMNSGPFDINDAVARNDMAIDSTAALLADNIESGDIPIYSACSKLLLGSAEKTIVVSKLRSMDGGKICGLIDEPGLNYYLDGFKLFQVVKRSSLPASDEFEQGGVWHRLMWDAPPQWRDNPQKNSTGASGSDEMNELNETESSRAFLERAKEVVAAPSSNNRFDQEKIWKKSAMVSELVGIWPSIEGDLAEASREKGGLKSAKAQYGYWNVEACIKWAVAHGKIKNTQSTKHYVIDNDGSPFANLLKTLFPNM